MTPILQKIRRTCGYFILAYVCLLAHGTIWIPALAEPAAEQRLDDFVIVRAEKSDTYATLAAWYLNDASQAWRISRFNQDHPLTPGMQVVVPLKPFVANGLRADEYQTVPVLAYQRLSKKKARKAVVTAANFKKQMAYLKESGYRAITLDQLLCFLEAKCQIPPKSVVITLDKGWRSVHDLAWPILKSYDFPATLFVQTDFIGSRKALSWQQLRKLAQNGFDIQCNGKTRRNLTRLKDKESFKTYVQRLEAELLVPKKLIEKKLKLKCRYLAYPYGETNSLVIAMLKKHGYRAALTLKPGSNPFFINNYKIRRSMISGKDDLEVFKKKLKVLDKGVSS